MLEIIFFFKNNTDQCREKLKTAFEKCRPVFGKGKSGTLKITFYSGCDNWGNIWSAVWSLTEQEWFVSSVSGWELSVSENGEAFKENLLEYCYKNKKGLFGNNPE